jgi:hypothetical protein
MWGSTTSPARISVNGNFKLLKLFYCVKFNYNAIFYND